MIAYHQQTKETVKKEPAEAEEEEEKDDRTFAEKLSAGDITLTPYMILESERRAYVSSCSLGGSG
jgi:hypothetical protein